MSGSRGWRRVSDGDRTNALLDKAADLADKHLVSYPQIHEAALEAVTGLRVASPALDRVGEDVLEGVWIKISSGFSVDDVLDSLAGLAFRERHQRLREAVGAAHAEHQQREADWQLVIDTLLDVGEEALRALAPLALAAGRKVVGL